MKSKLLISRCLVGENVRYDGGHCKIGDSELTQLSLKYELIFVCPEVLANMTIPRKPIEIVGDRILTQDGEDKTSDLDAAADKILKMVSEYNIKFALLKESSPSCGVSEIYDGSFSGKKIQGSGVIARKLEDIGIQIFSENQISELL